MLSELTKILDKDFIIGYFLPSFLFVTASFLLISIISSNSLQIDLLFGSPANSKDNISIEMPTNIALIAKTQSFWGIAASLFITLILSILLMVINTILIRILEGYYILNDTPLQIRQENLFNSLDNQINSLQEKYRREYELSDNASLETLKERDKLIRKIKERYPDKENILPTAFGNVIRSFEVYSRKMYGLDAIPSWSRIILLVPNDQKDSLNSSKAQVDFAVNLIYLSIIFISEYLVYAIWLRTIDFLWIPVLGLIVLLMGYRLALSSAIAWGGHVKAIFDLYRYSLLSQMGIAIPRTWEEERKCFEAISQSFIYQYKLEERRSDPIKAK